MNTQIFQLTGNTLVIGGVSIPFTFSGIFEVLVFSVVIYYIILWIQRTKAWSLLKGFLVLVVIYIVSKVFHLNNIAFLFENMMSSLLIATIVILQPEIRKALEQLGSRRLISGLLSFSEESDKTDISGEAVDAMVRAMSELARNKVGALVVIERNILLTEYIDTGISLDAKISSPLLQQIFEHNTPLHDGAVIIRNNRIVAATCYLPLSQNSGISKELGTRHRAGLGISEVADCVTLIASEETGNMSIAIGGVLRRNISADELRQELNAIRKQGNGSENTKKLHFWKGRGANERKN